MKLTFTRRRATMLGAAGLAIGGGVLARHILFGTAERREGRDQGSVADALFRNPADPVIGKPQGRLNIVEYYDYRCPYCIRMHPMLEMVLAEDRDIRFVAKQWPVFGGPSVTAARTALAAHLRGRFAPVDDALFKAGRELDAARTRAAAVDAGLNMEQMEEDPSVGGGGAIEASLSRVAMQALSMGLQGTPAFVIGPYLVPGAMTYENLMEVIAKARA